MAGDFDLMTAFGVLMENAAEAMQEAVQEIFDVTQQRVPRDTNALAESGRVSDPVIAIGQATVTLSYGNQDDATGIYAITQHERLDLQHPSGGTAKYVESPVLEAASTFSSRVATKMRGG